MSQRRKTVVVNLSVVRGVSKVFPKPFQSEAHLELQRGRGFVFIDAAR